MKDANHSYNLTLLILQNEKRLTFWLVLSCDLLERRRIDDVTINNVLTLYCIKKNRFHVAVGLYSKISHKT